MAMKTIVPANQECIAFAGWYLSKFINTYGVQFPNIQADYAALRQIIIQFNCRSVLEIGTWQGYASLFMWLTPCVTALTAIDICRNYGPTGGGEYHHDLPQSEYGSYFRGTPCKLIVGDINSYDWGAQRFDFVFVDGDHRFEQVQHDVELAKRIAIKAVACHDLGNGNVGVDQFFDQYQGPFSNVAGTSVAFIAL